MFISACLLSESPALLFQCQLVQRTFIYGTDKYSVKYYFYWYISSVEYLCLEQGSEMDLLCKTVIFLLLPLSLGVDGGFSPNFISMAGPLPSELAERLGLQEQRGLAVPEAQGDPCQPSLMASELPPYLQQLRELGVTHYKLLLPWASLLPRGSSGSADGARVRCYRHLLRALAAAGLRALLVLHQGRVPAAVAAQAAGSRATAFKELFMEYAEFSFRAFGDLVDVWLSFSDLPEVLQSLPYAEPQERAQAVAAAHEGFYNALHEKISPAGKESRVFQSDSQIFCDSMKWQLLHVVST